MPSQLQRKQEVLSDESSFAKQKILDTTIDFRGAPKLVVATELARLGTEIEASPIIKPIPQPAYERTEISLMVVLKIKFAQLLSSLVAFLAPKRKLSRRARRALSQLRKLAHLASASSAFSQEEQILFDTAFGQAYYEILSYAKQHQDDDPAHDAKYKSVMGSFVNSFL
jgi:hypothetical protein